MTDLITYNCMLHLCVFKTNFHYFMECPRYDVLQNDMFLSVVQHSNFTIRTLLYESSNVSFIDNSKNFEAVQRFIIDSKRLE